MSAAPDIAGLLEALAVLPDRTPEQRRAYALQLDCVTWPEREDGENGDPVGEVLGRLVGLKLSKAARKVIEEEFAEYTIEWA